MNELMAVQARLSAAPAATFLHKLYPTVLFSDLVGSTPLCRQMVVEDYAQIISPVEDIFEQVIPRFNGYVVEIVGDGLFAVFGYPEAIENAGQQAVLAALELHERVRSLVVGADGPSLRLHTGIFTGLVLVDEKNLARGRVKVRGNPTIMGHRLMEVAQADEILVSAATIGLDRGIFQTGERRYLTLKGKEKPIAAVRVLGVAHGETRFAVRERERLSPFVGREGELSDLDAELHAAREGRFRILAIAGDRGIGKTRLAGEFLHRNAPDFQIYRGECDAHLEPLQPFLHILRTMLGASHLPGGTQASMIEAALQGLGPKLEKHSSVLLHLLSPPKKEGTERRATAKGREPVREDPPPPGAVGAALRALFAQLAQAQPLALFIDDWQWADEASRKLIESLSDLEGLPLLVIVTIRSDELPFNEDADALERLVPSQARLIELGPLSREEAFAAVERLLPNADMFKVRQICEAAGGKPLFIEELCHSLGYGEDELRTHPGSSYLDNLIHSRFSRLPANLATLLRNAAVIGNVVPIWLLEKVTGRTVEDSELVALAKSDFLYLGEREGTLRFKHGMTRDVIYHSVEKMACQELHLTIAEALRERETEQSDEDLSEALAYHYGAADEAERTAHYARLAGDKALAASALDRAQLQYRAALAALDRLPPSPEIERRWSSDARRFALAGVWDPSASQLPILRRAVDRARARDDRLALALAEHWLAYIHYGLGNSDQAIRHSEQALATARPLGDARLEAQIRATLGQALWEATEHKTALSLLNEAIPVLRGAGGGEPAAAVGFAYSLAMKAWILADLGRFAEARALFDEALGQVRGIEHPIHASILSSYAVVCLWQGCIDEAVRIAEETQRVSSRVRTFYMYFKACSNGAYARWLVSEGADGAEALAQSTTWLEERGRDQYISLNHAWLAEIMAARGESWLALRHAASAIRRARRGDRLGEATALRAVVRVAASRRNWDRAAHYLRRAVAAARRRNSPHELATTRLCAAELALDRGDQAAALAQLTKAESAFQRMEMDWHKDQAARLRRRASE